ncbi:MAG: CD1871A family CXXC motif-containing protein [Lachnospiraceae bacterium]
MEKIIFKIIFICSLIFIVIGLIQNEHLIVLEKAVRICLECIGIG